MCVDLQTYVHCCSSTGEPLLIALRTDVYRPVNLCSSFLGGLWKTALSLGVSPYISSQDTFSVILTKLVFGHRLGSFISLPRKIFFSDQEKSFF